MAEKGSKNKIKKKIELILNEYRAGKGGPDYTHVSLGGNTFPGKFNFINKASKKSLTKYLAKAVDNGLVFSLAEKPKDYGPLKVDVDMGFPVDQHDGKRLYTTEQILELISIYRECIEKYCSIIDNELTCCLFEKETFSEKNGEIKDGIHLIFPHLVLHYKIRHLITNDVIKALEEKELFSHLIDPNVIDKAVVSTNCWMMYGCAKPNSAPYKLTKIYDASNKLINPDTIGDTSELIKFFSLRQSKWNETNSTLLSDNVDNDAIEEAFDELGFEKSKNVEFEESVAEDKIEMYEKALKILDMLNVKRADNYHKWIRVGWALHNTNKNLLDAWILFSKKSKKFHPGECERIWSNMRDDGYTIRSLMLWAKEDNPDEYSKFIKEDFENLLKKNAVNNTFMIAKALYAKYFDKFVCVGPRENTWYVFREHKWNKDNGVTLMKLLSEPFCNHYINASEQATAKAGKASGNDKKTFLDEAGLYNKIANSLMDINFKKRIIEEARYLFYDEKFLERLDENHDLICFNNGVYDLKLRKFRKGLPDDHISMSTNVDYIKWNENSPYAKAIHGFFEKVLTNKNVRNYFLSRLSTCLSGENREEKFYFLTGSGSNGKSLTFNLVSEALGDYYISCPITIITRKRGASNAASPELARLKGPRCGVFQEPGADEQLNVGIFKELSGNDRFMVRGLYKEPIEVKPQVKYFLTCNDLPDVPSDDGGTWRRIRVIDFASKFVDNPDPNNTNEFELDDTLKNKIINWAPTFAGYLIHLYTTTYDVDDKVPEPEEVKLSTNKYRKEQDVIREYFDTNLEVSKSKKDSIMKRDLWLHFKNWYKEDRELASMPKSKKLYEFIDKEIKLTYSHNGWRYLKFRTTTEEDEESDDNNDLDLDL